MVAHAEVGALVEDLIRLGFFELRFFSFVHLFCDKKSSWLRWESQ